MGPLLQQQLDDPAGRHGEQQASSGSSAARWTSCLPGVDEVGTGVASIFPGQGHITEVEALF